MTTAATFCAQSALNTDTLSVLIDWVVLRPHSTADCGKNTKQYTGQQMNAI